MYKNTDKSGIDEQIGKTLYHSIVEENMSIYRTIFSKEGNPGDWDAYWQNGQSGDGSLQSGDGSLIDKDGSTWYTAREVMTNAEESTDTCGEWNLSRYAPGNQLSANL